MICRVRVQPLINLPACGPHLAAATLSASFARAAEKRARCERLND
jgi:hypothetical protein